MAVKSGAFETHFQYYSVQFELARKLDEAFDVTFGDRRGDFSVWLAAPQDHIKSRFGLLKEILVVYSGHAQTDSRILRAIQETINQPQFRHRVDKILVLVIHEGQNPDADDILRDQTDWVIIPIRALDLMNKQRGGLFLRSRIAKVVGSMDLFGMSSPITSDKYFFGRSELVQALVDRTTSRHENSGLFGLRKTGKTSVLYAIQRRLASRPMLTEYIDCQNPGIHAQRWWQALENLAVRCGEKLKRDHKRDAQILGNYTQENAGMRFPSDVQSLLKRGNLERVVLMLDEIEYVTFKLSGALGHHWDQDFFPFWQTLRATHQETQGAFSFIVAGVNPACVEWPHFEGTTNPIFQLASPHYLEPLSVVSVREMVRTIGRYGGLQFQDPVHQYLQETYGGHPYLIRTACSEVWRTCDTTSPERLLTITVETFRRRSAQIKDRLAQPIKDVLLSLVWWYPEEYDLLRILASGDLEFVNQYLHEKEESVIQFARYGILREDQGQFAISDLRDFLIEHGEGYKKEISPFTRGDIPPDILPEVPDLAVLGQLFQMRSEIELKVRRAIILYLSIRYNWNPAHVSSAILKGIKPNLDRRDPQALFVGRSPKDVINDLYTLDLKSVILESWDLFGSLFDGNKLRFEMNMDTLNKARRVDAHTKPLTAEQEIEFRNSYGWLLSRLSKVQM